MMLKAIKVPRLSDIVVALLSLFLILFPKGGIKIAEKPLTIGYLLLFVVSYLFLFRKLLTINSRHLKALICLFPFQACSTISIFLNGWENLIILASYIIHFFIIPYALFITFPRKLPPHLLLHILKWIKNGVTFVALYGIFLFAYKLFRGKFLEIPFLTVNYHDLHLLETEKCIDRGGYFKLISTYNNGNLYGICILMLYPIYTVLEKRKLFKAVVVTSFILTLSRTVWIGLIFAEFLSIFMTTKLNVKNYLKIAYIFIVAAIFFLVVQFCFHFPFEFFFDKTLGHRVTQFNVLKTFSPFGNKPFSGIYEITFLGIYKSFGFLGLLSFFIAMTYPIFKILAKYAITKNLLHKKLAEGLIIYCFISLSDGAILLIPVMCFYWLISWLGLLVTSKTQSSYISTFASKDLQRP